MRVVRHLPTFDGRSKFSTWLYRVAMNTCHSYLERAGRSRLEFREELPERPDAASVPVQAVLDAELRREVDAALAGLSPRLRAAVVLTGIQGLDPKVAADRRLFDGHHVLADSPGAQAVGGAIAGLPVMTRNQEKLGELLRKWGESHALSSAAEEALRARVTAALRRPKCPSHHGSSARPDAVRPGHPAQHARPDAFLRPQGTPPRQRPTPGGSSPPRHRCWPRPPSGLGTTSIGMGGSVFLLPPDRARRTRANHRLTLFGWRRHNCRKNRRCSMNRNGCLRGRWNGLRKWGTKSESTLRRTTRMLHRRGSGWQYGWW